MIGLIARRRPSRSPGTRMPLIKDWLNRRPRLDFVVAGAEKAGTTAMFSYLKRVPGVHIPLPKELNFFDSSQR